MEEKYLKILTSILSRYPYTFYMLGSRTTPCARKLSDVDLFYKEKIPDDILLQLETELEESDLPFTVDLVGYQNAMNPLRKP